MTTKLGVRSFDNPLLATMQKYTSPCSCQLDKLPLDLREKVVMDLTSESEISCCSWVAESINHGGTPICSINRLHEGYVDKGKLLEYDGTSEVAKLRELLNSQKDLDLSNHGSQHGLSMGVCPTGMGELSISHLPVIMMVNGGAKEKLCGL